jgi:hypothetical protein
MSGPDGDESWISARVTRAGVIRARRGRDGGQGPLDRCRVPELIPNQKTLVALSERKNKPVVIIGMASMTRRRWPRPTWGSPWRRRVQPLPPKLPASCCWSMKTALHWGRQRIQMVLLRESAITHAQDRARKPRAPPAKHGSLG